MNEGKNIKSTRLEEFPRAIDGFMSAGFKKVGE